MWPCAPAPPDLHVRIDRLLARMRFDGNEQLYFHAAITGGTFGTGTGEELASTLDSNVGSYTPASLAFTKKSKRGTAAPKKNMEIICMRLRKAQEASHEQDR